MSIYVMVFVMVLNGEFSSPHLHDKAFQTERECKTFSVAMQESLKDMDVKYLIGCRKFVAETI